MKNERICFVIPQFGAFPGYIDYFIRSASYTRDVADFLFITDHPLRMKHDAPNVFMEPMSLGDFNKHCRRKLNVDFSIVNSYKLCDMKPMYGFLFEERLKSYGYWGHCDFDMIFGDVGKLLRDHDYREFDIFAVQQIYSSGPFQIFRNTQTVNRLFMHSPSWQSVLIEPGYKGFDEAGDVIRELWKGKDLSQCEGKVHSMTHLMKDSRLLSELNIKVSMRELITEKFRGGSRINFNKGKLTVFPEQHELYIYHFMNRKNLIWFNEMLWNKKTESFDFSDRGFRISNRIIFAGSLILSLIKRYQKRFSKKLKAMTYNLVHDLRGKR